MARSGRRKAAGGRGADRTPASRGDGATTLDKQKLLSASGPTAAEQWAQAVRPAPSELPPVSTRQKLVFVLALLAMIAWLAALGWLAVRGWR